jgi:hypothetical protein
MKILIDFSQIVISSAIQYHSQTKSIVDLGLLRHIALMNILSYKKLFDAEMSDIIICLDGRNYWRKEVFPQYKQNRKREHDTSKFDWSAFFKLFNQIKDEFKEELPFRFIEVSGAEADDVIAILCGMLSPTENLIILSSDKDFIQIQELYGVKQYSPHHKRYITKETSDYDLFEHIVRGDPGDGIPNILSDDNVYLDDNLRSTPIRKTAILSWKTLGEPELFCDKLDMLEKFRRNKQLIDLTQIPRDIGMRIQQAYFDMDNKSDRNTFKYLVDHGLVKILKSDLL